MEDGLSNPSLQELEKKLNTNLLTVGHLTDN
jgi:hypothetical protein